MNLLLDTHILLWAAGQPERLSDKCRNLLLNPSNNLIFSAASLWEISIKFSLGRSDFSVDPALLRRMLLLHAFRELSVNGEHAIAVSMLPTLHKDPFDRILITQARTEGMLLITSDSLVAAYGDGIWLVD
ncbi:MAG: type II toxin-antitoxin system VapC family toxin [Chlorobium sp.]